MLLDLKSVSRVRVLHILDTIFIVKSLQKYVFMFDKLHKRGGQGQKPTIWKFVVFPPDKYYCAALDKYLNRTERWRRANNETLLLLSYIQPHKQVMPSTISGLINNVLKSTGINVLLFPAHATRSATTPKVCAPGLSMIEICNMELGQTSLLGKGSARTMLSQYV